MAALAPSTSSSSSSSIGAVGNNNKKLSVVVVLAMMSSIAAAAAAAVVVPKSMLLSSSLQQALPALYESPLQALQFGSGIQTTSDSVTPSSTSTTLRQAAALADTAATAVSLCFVVRRPG